MGKLNEFTIKKVNDGLKKKEFSSKDLTLACLAQIKKRQPEINAFITQTQDIALSQAQNIDLKIISGEKINLIEGAPCAVKDNILIKNVKCTAGSKMLAEYISAYDATVIEKLERSGYVLLGKTNMDEFAMGSSCENSYFGPAKNPVNLAKVPGGSSGGSAAAVADHQCIYALGSDTGGSIRQPAALCGIVGLKPTYGRVSRYGLISMTSSFDQIGPLTRNVEDSEIVFKTIYGSDAKDSTSSDKKYSPIKNFNIKDIKIGISDDYFIEGMDKEIKESVLGAVRRLESMGAQIIEMKMPHLQYALSTYYLMMPAEVSSNLARYDGIRYGYHSEANNLSDYYFKTRSEGLGNEVKRRIILGTFILSAGYNEEYYKKAQKVRSLIIDDFNKAFEKADCLITPTTPATAFDIGLKVDDPLTMYLEDIFTVSINVAGLPAMSVPCGKASNGLPIGMQIIANHFNENIIFSVGKTFEQNI